MSDALRVLIIDEDPDSRVAARKSLQRAQLVSAGEGGYGTEAVALASETRPDLILLAVEDPVTRPLETAEAVANRLPSTPIIIYSSLDDAEAVRRAMVFGARDYLLKPLQGGRLRDAIYRALEQEEKRQMRQAGQLAQAHPRGSVITIAGAKGGIGKTVTSINLALAFARETGKSVAVIDADIQFGDVATMFDVRPAKTNKDLLANLARLDRTNVRDYLVPVTGSVAILASSEDGAWSGLEPGGWEKLLDAIARVFEFVVIDTAGSFDPFTRRCIESATLTLLLTSGEVSSIRDTAAALRRLDQWGIDPQRLRVVVNRSSGGRVGLDDIRQALARDVFWEIPHDELLPLSVQLGQPLVSHQPGGRASSAIIQLARLVAGTRTSLRPRPRARPPLLRRLLPIRGRAFEAPPAINEAPENPR